MITTLFAFGQIFSSFWYIFSRKYLIRLLSIGNIFIRRSYGQFGFFCPILSLIIEIFLSWANYTINLLIILIIKIILAIISLKSGAIDRKLRKIRSAFLIFIL
jgi:hypothetical protein